MLLSSLCHAAETLPDPSGDAESDVFKDLHIERLAGLDVSSGYIASANEAVTSIASRSRQIRWTNLDAKLWQGSLDVYNPELASYEFIVSTEVIEHLPEPVLQSFAPMVLGRYRPRFLLITTPNYSFNELFTKPGHVDQNSFPDPTGRTTRRFRHSDHKFEWREQEFIDWCDDAATRYGYSVVVGGVGRPLEDDPYGRAARYASQTALFRRDNGAAPVVRIPAQAVPNSVPHVLYSSHTYPAHPMAGIRKTPQEITERIKDVMTASQYSDMTIRELWNDAVIPLLCGGLLGALIDAVKGDSLEWNLDAPEGEKNKMSWTVEWRSFKAVESQPEEEYPNAWGDGLQNGIDEPEEEEIQVDERNVDDGTLQVAETAWVNASESNELRDGWGTSGDWSTLETAGWAEDVGGNPWSSATNQEQASPDERHGWENGNDE